MKIVTRGFTDGNGNLMAEVISTGYESPYKVGDKYLDVSAMDLKRARRHLDDLIKANKENRLKEFIGV